MKNNSDILRSIVIDQFIIEFAETLLGEERKALLMPLPERIESFPLIPIEQLREEQRQMFVLFAAWILSQSSTHPDPNSES